MPTYQYACTEAECGHAFEQVQSFSDDSLTTCPECRGRLRKLYNAVGVVFKGSGFYRTDSRKPEGSSTSDSSSGSDSTSESKPATKKSPEKSGASGTSGTSGRSDSKPAASTSA